MTLSYLLTVLSIDTIKEKITEVANGVSDYITLVVNKICEFLTTQNSILVGAILFLAAISILIGFIFFLTRKPKLFLIMIVILALIVGLGFFALAK